VVPTISIDFIFIGVPAVWQYGRLS